MNAVLFYRLNKGKVYVGFIISCGASFESSWHSGVDFGARIHYRETFTISKLVKMCLLSTTCLFWGQESNQLNQLSLQSKWNSKCEGECFRLSNMCLEWIWLCSTVLENQLGQMLALAVVWPMQKVVDEFPAHLLKGCSGWPRCRSSRSAA